MRLDAITVTLRPRHAWEAIDLGFAMVRAYAKPIYRNWLGIWLPFQIVLFAALWQHPKLTFFLLWWLKPVYDRLILHVLSQGVFGEVPSYRATWRALPGLLTRTALLANLLWRRFSFVRSFSLPVWQLEAQRGQTARDRLALLARQSTGHAVWFALVWRPMSTLFAYGLLIILAFFIPNTAMEPFPTQLTQWFTSLGPNKERVFFALISFMDGLVEPYFVAGGFGLYLHRRTQLEAWDLELRFRQMGQRLMQLGCAALLCFGLIAAPNSRAWADKPTADIHWQKDPDVLMQRVVQNPAFGEYHEVADWEIRKDDTPDWLAQLLERFSPSDKPKKPEKKKSAKQDGLHFDGEAVAQALRFAVWALGAALLVLLLLRLARNRGWVALWSPRAKHRMPTAAFGLDLRPESLPDDVPSTARALLAAGDVRAALSLLYRATLVAWLQNGLEILESDTEGDCVRKAQLLAQKGWASDAHLAHAATLMQYWQLSAYARQPIDMTQVETLCRDWPYAKGIAA